MSFINKMENKGPRVEWFRRERRSTAQRETVEFHVTCRFFGSAELTKNLENA
jgi:hypothetical protein